ncbi:MAG: GNAT family N-acetyltransferase [Alphaproteobacteria bacterium]|nr:GNAT family N-acetyltransferase [Alphaproteobacteria bacterium]
MADDGIGKSREDVSAPLNPNTAPRSPPSRPGVGAWRCNVESVRSAAARRGQGLGHALFEWVIAESRRRGCAVVQLTTDKRRTDARRFYEALGFTATHEGMKLAL